MKKIKTFSIVSLVISILAICLWAFTFFFGGKLPSKNNDTSMSLPTYADSSAIRIAYINTDTLMEKYALVKQLLNEMDTKKSQLNRDFNAQKGQFEKDVSYFQDQVKKGSLSDQSAQEVYQKLMARQDELVQLQDNYNSKLAEMEQQQTKILNDKVTEYLKQFNKDSKYYDFVFNYSETNSAMLDVNKAYDITKYVVDGLNEEYKSQKK